MALFDALIFDLDGTLWDTTEACAVGWNAALTELRLEHPPITPADIAAIMGLPHDEIFARVFPALDEAQHRLLAPVCFRHEEESIRRLGGRLYPGVAETLPHLQRPLAIVSNCQPGYIELFLDLHGWHALFTDFECHGNTRLSKGSNLRLVIERQGWKHPLYVGDTMGDELAARQAGVAYYQVSYGFGEARRPDARIDSLVTLLTV
jgi:phosphoglycolate phosphatase